MKKSTILLLWTLVFSFSCDNLLDKEPLDEVSNEDALENIEVVSVAMIGTYSGLLNTSYYFSMMVTYPEFAGGNVKLGNSTTSIGIERYNSLYNFTTTPFPNGASSTQVLGIYGDIYDVINRANNIIAAIPDLPDGTPEERNNLLGEAYFFRALAHFDLLRVYSQAYNFTADASHLGIALLESTPEVFELPARNTVLEVYEFIIDDLTQAIDLINENSQRTTSTTIWLSSNAAKALLARVHLYKEDWQVAARLASEVIESGAYQLATTDDYESIWSGLGGNGKQEVIFELDLATSTARSVGEVYGVGQDQAFGTASADLLSLYSSNDIRGTNTMIEAFDTGNGSDFLSKKFIFSTEIAYPIVLLRLSEVYLIRAEAYAELGQTELAQADLDVIKQRANPLVGNTTLTGNSLLEEIFRERRRELAFEGHLLFDLTRKRRGVTRVDCPDSNPNCVVNYPSNLFVLPIPQRQIDANPETQQNPGY